jgi:hypothetical protein
MSGQDDSTTYGYTLDPAQAGQMYGIEGIELVDSFSAETAVNFGAPVKRGTAPGSQCKMIDGSGDTFLGVARRTLNKEKLRSDTSVLYKATEMVNVVRKGRIWVYVSEAVVIGDTAYADANSTNVGQFSKTASGNVVTGGKFISAQPTPGGLAVLEII